MVLNRERHCKGEAQDALGVGVGVGTGIVGRVRI